jgi:hypothetical protein
VAEEEEAVALRVLQERQEVAAVAEEVRQPPRYSFQPSLFLTFFMYSQESEVQGQLVLELQVLRVGTRTSLSARTPLGHLRR